VSGCAELKSVLPALTVVGRRPPFYSLTLALTSLPFVTTFFERYPLAREQPLVHEDKPYFLNIAQYLGQKPAPFVPILDNNFEAWYEKVWLYILSTKYKF
jgi:Domain of unknown function (DUF1729)